MSQPSSYSHFTTANGAYAAFEEDHKGSLVPGKLADVTVLSKDIMKVPEAEIPTAVVDLTIVGAKVVLLRALLALLALAFLRGSHWVLPLTFARSTFERR